MSKHKKFKMDRRTRLKKGIKRNPVWRSSNGMDTGRQKNGNKKKTTTKKEAYEKEEEQGESFAQRVTTQGRRVQREWCFRECTESDVKNLYRYLIC